MVRAVVAIVFSASLLIGVAYSGLFGAKGKSPARLRYAPRISGGKTMLATRGRLGVTQSRNSKVQLCVRNPNAFQVSATLSPQLEAPKPVELAPCPFTMWGNKDIDIDAVQGESQSLPAFPYEINAKEAVGDMNEKEYFQTHKQEIMDKLKTHGAVVLRNFDLTKTPQGFRDMWENGLTLSPCQDPLQSVAARQTVSQKDGVFEAVNKPSLNKYFVGMHNEMVGTRTPKKAAFVCLKPAEKGGEFLILNGQQMLRDLNPDFLKRLYSKDMRYAVAQFPMDFLQDKPQFLQDLVKPAIKTVLDFAIKQKVDFYTESVWDTTTNNGDLVLQVRAAPNPPVLRHPETNEPVWFANIHSHSSKLRDMRAKIYSGGDEGRDKTTGSSKINLTDVFYGDGTPISEEDLKHVAEVTMKNVKFIKLNQGDVVLVDNYKTQHGRNVFEGTRKNAVTW
eukprot:CAMPEP_0167749360 /NCGR_PEP_ID=MMETSP0110_2-20121227/5361_1 /TAXON_ID=629695 /ORGANISM="Gymnochlora sp., Strain CCMP2014" /LENGTH=447 /DNA_ID=CAMNT_0007634499 /DNA_START=80 /DNA_END=1420 /DNA_ORIENTATION=-